MLGTFEQPPRRNPINFNLAPPNHAVPCSQGDVSGWAKNQGTETYAPNTSTPFIIPSCLRVETLGNDIAEGVRTSTGAMFSVTPGIPHTLITTVKAPNLAKMAFYDDSITNLVEFSGNGTWKTILNQFTPSNSLLGVRIVTWADNQAITFDVGQLIIREGTY